MDHAIAGFVVEDLLRALVARGCDEAALRESARLPPGRRFTRLPYETLDDLMEGGLAQTRDPNLGLHLCGAIRPESGGALGLLLLACPDLATAMRRVIRFQRLISGIERMRIVEEPDAAWLIVTLPDEERPAARHVAEWMLGDFRTVVPMLTGRAPRPEVVEFRHAAPAQTAEHDAWFGAPIRFGAEQTRIRMSAADWRMPVRSASETFRAIFERKAAEDLAALPSGTRRADRVRQVLREALPEALSLEQVAEALRTTPRSLQRALQREGTSLSAELDAVRREEAERLLGTGAEIPDVSWRLGYSEPSALHRAFRRWNGTTPEAWRGRHRPRS